MRRESKEVMEMLNVSYVEKPKAIYQFIKNGYSVNDIIITKKDPRHYNMIAIKNL